MCSFRLIVSVWMQGIVNVISTPMCGMFVNSQNCLYRFLQVKPLYTNEICYNKNEPLLQCHHSFLSIIYELICKQFLVLSNCEDVLIVSCQKPYSIHETTLGKEEVLRDKKKNLICQAPNQVVQRTSSRTLASLQIKKLCSKLGSVREFICLSLQPETNYKEETVEIAMEILKER